MKKNDTRSNQLNFEGSLSKLEDIIQQMEDGGQPLEKMMIQFEEGMQLVEQCRKALDNAELRVTTLMKDQAKEKLKSIDENDNAKN
ncbi:MAG: exodeoxyribonuclease VII small subunit [Chromatiales bacterium]|nr:exodeoxyribonuclease VII small subunit [Chromatiales bacterium]